MNLRALNSSVSEELSSMKHSVETLRVQTSQQVQVQAHVVNDTLQSAQAKNGYASPLKSTSSKDKEYALIPPTPAAFMNLNIPQPVPQTPQHSSNSSTVYASPEAQRRVIEKLTESIRRVAKAGTHSTQAGTHPLPLSCTNAIDAQ